MTYVISYDISDDDVRSAVSTLLGRYGQRVQESVFEARLESDQLEELCRYLQMALKTDTAGNIRIYRVCADCLAQARGLGRLTKSTFSQPCLIT
jgi:CRISPR-associated protein Cas2